MCVDAEWLEERKEIVCRGREEVEEELHLPFHILPPLLYLPKYTDSSPSLESPPLLSSCT